MILFLDLRANVPFSLSCICYLKREMCLGSFAYYAMYFSNRCLLRCLRDEHG